MTRALADMVRSGPADEGEMVERALGSLPHQQRGSFGGEARVALAVAGGPRRSKCCDLPNSRTRQLAGDLQREAMFSADAPLDRAAATGARLESNQLTISQDHAQLMVHEDGTIVVMMPVSARGPTSGP